MDPYRKPAESPMPPLPEDGIDVATGENLDRICAILGVTRKIETDADLRARACRVFKAPEPMNEQERSIWGSVFAAEFVALHRMIEHTEAAEIAITVADAAIVSLRAAR